MVLLIKGIKKEIFSNICCPYPLFNCSSHRAYYDFGHEVGKELMKLLCICFRLSNLKDGNYSLSNLERNIGNKNIFFRSICARKRLL